MGQALCNIKGCKIFLTVIPVATDGTCDFTAPKALKRTTSWSISTSSEDGSDGEIVDNDNGCTTGASSCSSEISWSAQLCNTANNGQNDLKCNSSVLIAGWLHDGGDYSDATGAAPAEANLLFGGYAKVASWDLDNSSASEVITVSATFELDAGKYHYGVLRDETETLTFNDLCAMAS